MENTEDKEQFLYVCGFADTDTINYWLNHFNISPVEIIHGTTGLHLCGRYASRRLGTWNNPEEIKKAIKLLLKDKNDLYVTDEKGYIPLMSSLHNNDVLMAIEWLDAGYKITESELHLKAFLKLPKNR